MWTKVVESGQDVDRRGRRCRNLGARVAFRPDTPDRPNRIDPQEFLTVLTSLAAAAAAASKKSGRPVKGRTHVSRQSPNPRRRKGTAQGPRGIQAGDRRKVRHAILHNQSGWQECPDISIRGMGTDRAEAGGAFDLQSHQEEVDRKSTRLNSSHV